MTDKEAQLKAKLLKIKLAEQKKWSATGLSPEEVRKVSADHEKRRNYMKLDPTKNKNKVTESDFHDGNFEIKDAKAKIKKLKKTPIKTMEKRGLPENILEDAAAEAGVDENQSPSYIAQEHGHRIAFRAHSAGNFRTASLNEQSGKYAKYWLLNAKDTNGNGWGIASHTAKENMKKFIGRPLVVTASSWHGASEYGDEYEHPYLPTNDITAILDHQEKFRVGSIVDVVEDSHGDWFANVEMLPRFASSRLPPFCSPAIYQLDASEAEGQISKWEALHLAALTENPAYGARIALLKGTCVGTGSECKVQFKVAKQVSIMCPKKKQKISSLKSRLAIQDVSEPFKMQRFNGTEPHKLHPKSLDIQSHAVKKLGTSVGFTGSHFLTTDGQLLGDGKREHRSMSAEILRTFPDKKFNAMAAEADAKSFSRWGTDGRHMDTLLEQTGMSRVSADKTGMNIDSKHPLTKSQRTTITQHLEDNNIGSDNVFIDDDTPSQKTISKQLRLGKEDPTEKLIKQVKDPKNKEDLLNRLDEKPNEYGPKNFGGTKRKDFGKRIGKLKARIASPIKQETGEGINFKIVKPKQPLENRTYGFHNVPIHPSNTTLIRPHKTENQMPLIKHFRDIQHKELPNFVQGSVQQFIRNNDVGGLSSPFGGRLKDHATISRGINQELKKGDILMRRVGGKPGQEGYGQVGDTFYIEKDSPKGELFKYESKYKRNNASSVHKTSKLKSRLAAVGLPDSFGKDKKNTGSDKKLDKLVDSITKIYNDERRKNILTSPRAGNPFGMRSDPTTPLIKEVPFGPDTKSIENLEHGNPKNYTIPSHDMSEFNKFEAEQDSLPKDKQFPTFGDISGKGVKTEFNTTTNKNVDANNFRVIPHGGISIPAEQKRKSRPMEKRNYDFGKLKARSNNTTKKREDATGIALDVMNDEKPSKFVNRKTKKIRPNKPVRSDYASIITAKLKARLAGLGDENMTYQNSKKVKLHKTKNMGKHDKD